MTAPSAEQQADRVVEVLCQEGLQTEAFKQCVAWIRALGREPMAVATGLMQSALMQRHTAGLQDQLALQALAGLRAELEALNPGDEGDLLKPRKWLGFIPLPGNPGNRLAAHFRRQAQAVPRVHALVTQLYAARDGLQRDLLDMESVQGKLQEALHKLSEAAGLAQVLDARLVQVVQALQASDPARARVLSEEVLFTVRQQRQEVLTQHAVCANGTLALDLLQSTGRELIKGCTRVATAGLSALAVAQTVARALGHQAQVAELMGGLHASLSAETTQQLAALSAQSPQLAQDPAQALHRIREGLAQALVAMEGLQRPPG